MRGLEFPIIGTKVKGLKQKFDLSSPAGRAEYFQAKVGDEIKHIKDYLKENTFIAYLLGKKNSGKGTYSKMFTEIFGEEKVATISVGDIVRETHANWESFVKSPKYLKLKSIYRGYISLDEAVEALLGRSTEKLLPTEFILALLKLYIEDYEGKSIFIDGLPRETDQVSYSLFFRDLVNYRQDPDMFILIDIPEAVISERIKYRRICPVCQTSRNLKLLITSKIEYDPKDKKFYLICDNPSCKGERMVEKEGDELGIEPIRTRLDKDEEILKKTFALYGIPKILLRNHIPVSEAKANFDDYEITPEYVLKQKNGKVLIEEKPWSFKDDNGVESFSLLAPPVIVSFIKQLVEVLEI